MSFLIALLFLASGAFVGVLFFERAGTYISNVDDRDGLKQVLTCLGAYGVARLRKLWADGGYQGEAIPTWGPTKKRRTK